MPRIGIYGGTFDPIHIGHLLAASHACDAMRLDKVVFVPAAKPPHKTERDDEIVSYEHRYNMTVLAIANDNRFTVSDVEQRLTQPSYTINTVDALAKTLPTGAEIFFVAGMDAVCDLTTWREPEKLLERCQFAVANRMSKKSLQPVYDAFGSLARQRIVLYDAPLIEISATSIRERIMTNRSIKYYVSASVEKYIYDNKLYH